MMTAHVTIRPAQPSELAAAGALCVKAYAAAGVADENSWYGQFLADAPARAATPHTEVLLALLADDVVGTATMCAYGSPLTQVCVEGEMEPRAIAVDSTFQRRGIAKQLIAASVDWARDHGFVRLAVCVAQDNLAAHQLYQGLGFTRAADRDWIGDDGTALETYTLDVPALYCGRCGNSVTTGDHGACVAALELEPPRYCTVCRRRMVVQIVPTGFSTTCSRHGTISLSVD